MRYPSGRPLDREVREGEPIRAPAASAANILRGVREMITNTLGGRMKRYRRLINAALECALTGREAKTRGMGDDGHLAVRIIHPHIAGGAREIFV